MIILVGIASQAIGVDFMISHVEEDALFKKLLEKVKSAVYEIEESKYLKFNGASSKFTIQAGKSIFESQMSFF